MYMDSMQPLHEEVQKGNITDELMEAFQPMYDHMANDISKQNKRFGYNELLIHHN